MDRAQDFAAAGAGGVLTGGLTYLGMLLALRKKRMSRLTKHLVAGGTGLLAGGLTYGLLGHLADKYGETPDQMRKNVAKSGLPIEVIEDDERGTLLRTTADYTYKIGKVTRTIPKGFVFDGTSAPVILKPLFGSSTDPRTLRAGLEHDWEYRNPDTNVTRKQADRHFRDRALEGGLSDGAAGTMYAGLRMFGAVPYYSRKYF